MNNLIFKNSDLQTKLKHEGYAVMPLLNSQDIAQLLALYKTYYPEDSLPVFNSFARNAEVRTSISQGIQQVFKPRLEQYFDGFRITMGIFFIKNKAEDNHIGIHQDPTLLKNECLQEHINFWCPLQDVNKDNGAMQVFAGSHLMFPPVQALTIPTPFGQHSDLIYRQMQTIDMKAGEVLVFDNRLIHSSTSNTTNGKRICVVSSIIPASAEWFSFYRNPNLPNSDIEVYEQQPDCYLDVEWTNNMEPPKTGKKIGLLDFRPFTVSEDELNNIIKNRIVASGYNFRLLPA
jgi:ectoine hydroxylase-related dioxygenase (phytanoyl-CoA dioxygenase family)